MSITSSSHYNNDRESISIKNNNNNNNRCYWGRNAKPCLTLSSNELREERRCARKSRPEHKVSFCAETASHSLVECCYLRSRAQRVGCRRRQVNLAFERKGALKAVADSPSGDAAATSMPCLAEVSTVLPEAVNPSVEGTPCAWLGHLSSSSEPFNSKRERAGVFSGASTTVKKSRRTCCFTLLTSPSGTIITPCLTAFLPNARLQKRLLHALLTLLLLITRLQCGGALLSAGEPTFIGLSHAPGHDNGGENVVFSNSNNNNNAQRNVKSGTGAAGGSVGSPVAASGYLDKLDNLERSVAAVLIKVAYGTTSTTKRSIPDNSYVPSLTTIATPLLTTLRYAEKSSHQQQINLHHRNYELDLERDHALPTSAPNADILKSNSNPTYPNPNRHHNHDRERHRHLLNSTPLPSLPNILKKNGVQSPTIPMYPADIPSYSPPARSFFTPPLPPEYQNPFADKPTLRGTNNEGIVANTGTYINRRPIPPPSLMPGHERIPFRPPDLAASTGGGSGSPVSAGAIGGVPSPANPISSSASGSSDADRKKALNTPSRGSAAPSSASDNKSFHDGGVGSGIASLSNQPDATVNAHNTRKEVLPSIRRILNGSNGNKGEIPEVLLKQVTSRPVISYHQPPSSPVVLIDNTVQQNEDEDSGAATSNINKSKNISNSDRSENDHYQNGSQGHGDLSKLMPKTKMSTKSTELVNGAEATYNGHISSTPSAAAAIGEASGAAAAATSTSSTTSATDTNSPTLSSSSSSSSSSSTAAAAAAHATWTIAWNIHVYLSVILFTILAVYSFYKMLTYNKLTHLFSQSYFVCIHLILLIICTTRIFYLCYDAYNIHASFHIFVSELLLNLPATFLTISFSVLILFLFLKSLNHKNNRYSALIRPLTVVVGCGVHVVLCITLHYVESYTMQNHQQQLYYQQQQQLFRRQQQQYLQQQHQQYLSANLLSPGGGNVALHQSAGAAAANVIGGTPPPRVLSLICQIIYIFICLSLGLLYLYLYRILKRILRSKSQNYIHGYQNLSYAIHITIATALLFVLLAALQIFGAISISTTRPLIAQLTAEIDWLQWGYQFSLRLIEIAIITLVSWVASLKTSGSGGGASVGIGMANGDTRLGTGAGGSAVFGTGAGGSGREKNGHNHHHHNHSNVAGFFLPCTSSSSQEQFDTDYPAVCNANTNLHTYTMRTGKLIYDDSFALNSLAGQPPQVGGGGTSGRSSEFQLQQPTYQRPYDTGSIHSSANHTVADYAVQGTLSGGRYHHDMHQYADYLTDATTDHYENPNFDLRGSGSGSGVTNSTMQKFTKTSTTSTTASSSGGSGSSAASQQQMLLLQNDNCYSEPLQPSCNASASYDFNNFERPKPNAGSVGADNQHSMDCWSEPQAQPLTRVSDKREKKSHHATLDRSAYENPERRSSNSTHSCASSSGGRYASYNSFERGHYNGVRKSGTLNNIVGGSGGVVGAGGIIHGRNSSSSSAASSNVSTAAQRASGVQTLAMSERHHYGQQQHSQRSGRAIARGTASREHDIIFGRSSLERSSGHARPTHQPHHQQHQTNSDDEMMITSSNVERTNLINNEDGSGLTTNSSTTTPDGTVAEPALCPPAIPCERLLGKASARPITEHSLLAGNVIIPGHHHHHHANSSGPDSAASTMSATSSSVSESATSGSMLVAEHGFVRFRALDDINNAQGVGIHNASIRKQGRAVAVATGQTSATVTSTAPAGKTPIQHCVAQNS